MKDAFKHIIGYLSAVRPYFIQRKAIIIVAAVILVTYGLSKASDETTTVYIEKRPSEFKKERVLGNPNQKLLEGKERRFSKSATEIVRLQNDLKHSIENLEKKMELMQKQGSQVKVPTNEAPSNGVYAGKVYPPPSGIKPDEVANFTVADQNGGEPDRK